MGWSGGTTFQRDLRRYAKAILDSPIRTSACSGSSLYPMPRLNSVLTIKPRMPIWNGFGTHETLEILEYCFENNIVFCRMPSHISHKLQTCDVTVFGSLKAAYREQVERMDRGGINTIGKQHFTYLYSPAREKALTKRNILAAWRGSGLFPFNPDRVLADTPKPPELNIPKANEMRVSCPEH
jgi:hypothetical protein